MCRRYKFLIFGKENFHLNRLPLSLSLSHPPSFPSLSSRTHPRFLPSAGGDRSLALLPLTLPRLGFSNSLSTDLNSIPSNLPGVPLGSDAESGEEASDPSIPLWPSPSRFASYFDRISVEFDAPMIDIRDPGFW